jgi:hypothetical protein
VFEYVFDDGRRAAEANWHDIEYMINRRDENGIGRPDWTQAPVNPLPMARCGPPNYVRTRFSAVEAKEARNAETSRR